MDYCRNPSNKKSSAVAFCNEALFRKICLYSMCSTVRHDFNSKYPEVLGSRALYSKNDTEQNKSNRNMSQSTTVEFVTVLESIEQHVTNYGSI